MTIMPRPGIDLFIDIEPEEIWKYSLPKIGDHIRVSRGLYNHHGIYVSDEEVVHFTGTDDDNILDWSKNEVIKTDLKDFLRDGRLEVKEYTQDELLDLYPVEHIVHYARGCIGDTGYNLIINNCEHFANMCTLGRFRSKQVERVFNLILKGSDLPLGRSNDIMGLLGRVGDAWNALWGKGSSGSSGRTSTSTSNTYTYEPDKVKVAEIEADVKLRLSGMENERIELMKNARLEILEFEVKSNIALEEAKARGLSMMAQTILTMQEKLNDVAEKRLTIIEKGSLQIIKEIECFYNELGDKISSDDKAYSTDKLPQLLSLLENYEIGSPSHDLYKKRIEDDMQLQVKHYSTQIENLSKRQSQIIDGFLESKNRIIEQTGQLTAGLIENMAHNYSQLQLNESNMHNRLAMENVERTKMIGSPVESEQE